MLTRFCTPPVFAKTSSRVALYSGVGAAVGFGSAAYLLWRGPDDDSAAAIAAAESGYQTAHRVATGEYSSVHIY